MRKTILILLALTIVTGVGYGQVPVKRKRTVKTEQTQSSEAKRQQEAEAKRQREAEAKRQREAEAQRQREAEAQRQREAEQRATRQNMINSGKGDNGVYQVGWYYNQNGKEGVVFEVDASGKHGKIVNLRHSESLAWSTYNYTRHSDNLIGANSDNDGEYNTNVIKRQNDWRKRYAAANYCVNLGYGWYFPARYELFAIVQNKDAINKTLKDHGGDEIDNYWSSTESAKRSSQHPDIADAMAFYVMNFDTKAGSEQFQFNNVKVRAVAKF